MKTKTKEQKHTDDRRSETRGAADQFDSVEVAIKGMAPLYVYKLRDISPTGMGILVKEGSEFLNLVAVGDVLNMKFNPKEVSEPVESLMTEIKHITRDDEGKFQGHFVVGLSAV
ncbi:MAG: PilZ domain-containing protein [Desulfobacterales bacterium]